MAAYWNQRLSVIPALSLPSVTLPGTGLVQLVKIVRFTDAMPSSLSLEIDVHEICHAIAALQPIDDPCHADNGGVIESAPSAAVGWR